MRLNSLSSLKQYFAESIGEEFFYSLCEYPSKETGFRAKVLQAYGLQEMVQADAAKFTLLSKEGLHCQTYPKAKDLTICNDKYGTYGVRWPVADNQYLWCQFREIDTFPQ
jgi:hypothetical protein